MPLLIPFITALFSIYTIRAIAQKVIPPVVEVVGEVIKNSKKYVDANPGDFDPNLETGSYNTFQVVEKTKWQKVNKVYVIAAILIALTLIKKMKK